MSQYASNLQSSGGSSGNASVGPNNTPAPTSSTEIGFINGSGNLTPVSPTNPLPITIESEAGTLNVNVSEYGGIATSLGQKTSAASEPVVIASDQSTLPISAASLPLPTGASTSALQTSGNASLTSILANQTNGTQVVTQSSGANLHVDVDNFPATQPISGTVTANQGTSPWVENVSQFGGSPVVTGVGASGAGIPRVTVSNDSNILASQSGTWNINNVSGTVSLPTGASTSANQSTANTSLSSILANQTNGTQTVTGTGTAGTPAAGVLTVQGNASGTPIPISGTVTTSTAVNTNGSVSNSTTVTNTSATTFSPPTNAVGFVVEAESSNTVNLRYACGTTATTSVGMLLEPGRDSGYIPSSGTVTVICSTVATNQAASIQWVLSS